MIPISVPAFRYMIFPGLVRSGDDHFETYLNIYQFWKNTWIQEMTAAGGDPGVVIADDFLRQTEIAVVLCGREVVAMLMSTAVDLSTPVGRDVKYFAKFPPSVIEELGRDGPLVATMEFLTVNPDWRTARAGVSMGPVMIGLVAQRARRLGASASVGVARVDNRVDEAMGKFGGTPLAKITKANIECQIVAMYQKALTPHPNPKVEEMMARLTRKQIDLCEPLQSGSKRIAA